VAVGAADLEQRLVVLLRADAAAVDVVDVQPALPLGAGLGVGLAALLAAVAGPL
jgi:hypothetical protein